MTLCTTIVLLLMSQLFPQGEYYYHDSEFPDTALFYLAGYISRPSHAISYLYKSSKVILLSTNALDDNLAYLAAPRWHPLKL